MSFIEIIENEESFTKIFGESNFKLRRFNSSIYRKIEKTHTSHKRNKRSGRMDAEIDDNKVQEDLIDYIILGWDNIKSPLTGDNVECTKENKAKLPGVVIVDILEECDSDNVSEKKTNSKT